MPCFATIRENSADGTPLRPVSQQLSSIHRGRQNFRKVHSIGGVLFSSIFTIVLLNALQQDGYINVAKWVLYLPSMILLWPSALVLCCGVLLGGIDDEERKSLAGICSFPQTLLAVSVTLIATSEPAATGGITYGSKFIPIFVGAAPFLFFTCIMCVFDNDNSPRHRFGFCAFIAFVVSILVILIQIAIKADGGYGDDGPTWLSIFAPSFAADFFIVPFLVMICVNLCNSQRGLNDTSSIFFALSVLLNIGWVAYFIAKILFIVREDSIPLYYTMGNIGVLKHRDTTRAIPAMVCILFLLLFIFIIRITLFSQM